MRVLISGSSSFWLSREAVLLARELGAAWATPDLMPIKGEENCWIHGRREDYEEGYSIPNELPRHDPLLLEVFDRLGREATGGPMCRIHEVWIPDDVTYFISSYCAEWVAEQHRVWDARDPEGHLAGSPTNMVFSLDSLYQPPPERSE